jgi:hypothetical protein
MDGIDLVETYYSKKIIDEMKELFESVKRAATGLDDVDAKYFI